MKVCDKCGKPAHITMVMPRVVEMLNFYQGEQKGKIARIDDRETDICEDCYREIAKIFHSC